MGKGEITKQAIIDQARILFAQKGFDSTKINEIASAANISEATIYKYFESKTELLLACVTPTNLTTGIDNDYSHMPLDELIKQYAREMVEKIIANRSQYEILFNEIRLHPDISNLYIQKVYHQEGIEKEVASRIESGEITTVSDYLLFNVGLIGALLAMMRHLEIQHPLEKMEHMSSKLEEIVHFILYGLSGNE